MLTTIMFVFVGVAPLAVIFYCFRSTKEFPKNWSELKCEVLYQYAGLRGLIEDYWLSKYNRAGNYYSGNRADWSTMAAAVFVFFQIAVN